jgi:hypothetical protein
MPVACTKTYTLAPLAAKPTPTATPSPTPLGPIIEAFYFNENLIGPAPESTNNGVVFIQDGAGNPVSTATVAVSLAGTSTSLPYLGNTTPNFPTNIGVTNIYSGEYEATVPSYPAGSACTFTAIFNGTTYTAVCALPAVSGAEAQGTSGVTCSWTAGGNDNFVQVTGADTLQQGPSPVITSPVILPNADFPNDPAGAGNDFVQLALLNLFPAAFAGCQSSSVILAGSLYGTYY